MLALEMCNPEQRCCTVRVCGAVQRRLSNGATRPTSSRRRVLAFCALRYVHWSNTLALSLFSHFVALPHPFWGFGLAQTGADGNAP